MPTTQRPSRWMVILAFGLVYLFWGSTYLGIDIAVQSIPPALMCATRFSLAGVVMLVACAVTGRTVLYSPRQIALAGIVGVLLLMGGNLTLSYAELSVSSGLAALILASTPLWFLVLDSLLLGDHHISSRGKAGLGLGVLGLFVLFYPQLTSKTALGRRELWASLTLIAGSFSWALGSVLSKRWQSGMDVFSATGWQMTAAGASNFVFALLAGDFAHVLDHPRRQRDVVSGGLRLVDRLQRLHLAARARAHVQGLNLCLRQSRGGSFPRLADPPRARRSLHPCRKRHSSSLGNPSHQRKDKAEDNCARTASSRSSWRLSPGLRGAGIPARVFSVLGTRY